MNTNLRIALPTSDLEKAYRFYRDGLGFSLAVPAKGDEMPEPVIFAVGGANVMLVPSFGFERVLSGHPIATKGTSECVVGITVATKDEVQKTVDKARAAGGTILSPPTQQQWAYAATFSDLDGHIWMVAVGQG
jgi:predicted lactoylglutathione lyase